jgi:N-glycosylase/DNA lyase
MYEIKVKNDDFNLKHTFDCGQCFRWDEEADGSFSGVAGGRFAHIYEKDDNIVIETTKKDDEAFWTRYLDLGRDYKAIKKAVSVNPLMEKAVSYGGGIRILRQEFFETLISFIISQRSSIPKIKSTVKKMSERYGEKIETERGDYYSFPNVDVLSSLSDEEMRSLGVGYRAPYILRAAKAVKDGDISEKELCTLETVEARKKLMTMYGVGDKVCDCIMLFSLAKYDLFPSDVWIKRVMSEEFNAPEDKAKSFGEELFGEYSGFAQQYLFYYRRNLKE